MIMFYQNEIIALKEIIQHWNQDVLAIRKKDSELSKQLEPKKQELINYQSDPKKNKKEITALKKQCSDLEKERKLLTQQMGKNSKELSKYLDVICKEAQGAAKERYADIIDNINYVFQDSITGL
jgi:chromosome segregation ATPase